MRGAMSGANPTARDPHASLMRAICSASSPPAPAMAAEAALLRQINVELSSCAINFQMWRLIVSLEDIPTDRDLHLAVMDHDGLHALVFPCRCAGEFSWIDATTRRPVEVHPTHWREWTEGMTRQA